MEPTAGRIGPARRMSGSRSKRIPRSETIRSEETWTCLIGPTSPVLKSASRASTPESGLPDAISLATLGIINLVVLGFHKGHPVSRPSVSFLFLAAGYTPAAFPSFIGVSAVQSVPARLSLLPT